MRFTFIGIILALLVGCAKAPSTPDSIDTLVAKLSSDGVWMNGVVPPVYLPETASPKQVIASVFEVTIFDKGYVRSYKILKIRQVHIGTYLHNSFTAALVRQILARKSFFSNLTGQ